MLNSIKKLSGCRILATDGEVGAVAEAVYFDDEQWVVRYLVVDTVEDTGPGIPSESLPQLFHFTFPCATPG
jgi:hypothetical protein